MFNLAGRNQAGRRLYELTNKVRTVKASSSITSTSTPRPVAKKLGTSLQFTNKSLTYPNIKKEPSENLHSEERVGKVDAASADKTAHANTGRELQDSQMETADKPFSTQYISLGESIFSKQSSPTEVSRRSELLTEKGKSKSFQKLENNAEFHGAVNDEIKKWEEQAMDKLSSEKEKSSNEKSKINQNVSEAKRKGTKLGSGLGKGKSKSFKKLLKNNTEFHGAVNDEIKKWEEQAMDKLSSEKEKSSNEKSKINQNVSEAKRKGTKLGSGLGKGKSKSFKKLLKNNTEFHGAVNDEIKKWEEKAMDKLSSEKEKSLNENSKINQNISEAKRKRTKLGRGLDTHAANKSKSPSSSTRYAKKKSTTGHANLNNMDDEDNIFTSLKESIANYNNIQNEFVFKDPNAVNFELYSVIGKTINNPFVEPTRKRLEFDILGTRDVDEKAIEPFVVDFSVRAIISEATNGEVTKKEANTPCINSVTTDLQNTITKGSLKNVNNETNTDIINTKTAKNTESTLFGANTEQAKIAAAQSHYTTLRQGIFQTETNADECPKAESGVENVISDTQSLRSLISVLNSSMDERLSVRAHKSRLDLKTMLDENLGNRIYEQIVPTNISSENINVDGYESQYRDTSNDSKLTVQEISLSSVVPKSTSMKVGKKMLSAMSLPNAKDKMKQIPQQGENKHSPHINLNEFDLQLTSKIGIRQIDVNAEKKKRFTGRKKIDKSKADSVPSINEKNQDTLGDQILTANTNVDGSRLRLPTLENKKTLETKGDKWLTGGPNFNGLKLQLPASVNNNNQESIENRDLRGDTRVGASKLRLPTSSNKKNQETTENKVLPSDVKAEATKLRLPASGNKKNQETTENKGLPSDVKAEASKLRLPASGNKKNQATTENKGLTSDVKAEASKLRLPASGNKKNQETTENKGLTSRGNVETSQLRLPASGNKKNKKNAENKRVTTDYNVEGPEVEKLRLTGLRNKKVEERAKNKNKKVDSSVLLLTAALENKKREETIATNRLTYDVKVGNSKLDLTVLGKSKVKKSIEYKKVKNDSRADSSKLRLTHLGNKTKQESDENKILTAVDNMKAHGGDSSEDSRVIVGPKIDRRLTSSRNISKANFSLGESDRGNLNFADFITASQLNSQMEPNHKAPFISNKKSVSTANNLQMYQDATSTEPSNLTLQPLMKATPNTVMPFNKARILSNTSVQRASPTVFKISMNHSPAHLQKENISTRFPLSGLVSKLIIKQEHRTDVSNTQSPKGNVLVTPGSFFLTSLDPIQPENTDTPQENILPSNVVQPEIFQTNSGAAMPTVSLSKLVQSETTDDLSHPLDFRAVSLGQAAPYLVEDQSAADLQSRSTPTSGVLSSTLQRAYLSTDTNDREYDNSRKVPLKPAALHRVTVPKGLHLATQSGATAQPTTLTYSTHTTFIKRHNHQSIEKNVHSASFRAKSRAPNIMHKAVPGVSSVIENSALERSSLKNLKAVLLPALGLPFSVFDLKYNE